MKRVVSLFLVLLITFLLQGCGGRPSDMEMGTAQLFNDYVKSGQQAGDAKYKGKIIAVSGKVEGVGQFNDGSGYYVSLETQDTFGIVQFYFPNMNDVKNIKEGDLTKIQGQCNGLEWAKSQGYTFGIVRFNNSKVLEK